CVESFFHSLKVECIHGEHFISREIMVSERRYHHCDDKHFGVDNVINC
ncbi:hypothetical protein CEH00_04445, partial [Shigella boydii]